MEKETLSFLTNRLAQSLIKRVVAEDIHEFEIVEHIADEFPGLEGELASQLVHQVSSLMQVVSGVSFDTYRINPDGTVMTEEERAQKLKEPFDPDLW